MATVPPVAWAFFPLDEELELRPQVAFTPKLEEGMARLGTWMPFRCASRELAFFTGVQVSEGAVRQLTEQAGATYERLQDEQAATLLQERPESPMGPTLQLMSLDGVKVPVVGGEWREAKTVALGVVHEPVEERGEQVVHTSELSYFSRMIESEQFQQAALGEIHRRGVETAGQVCAVSDGADWIPKFVDYHRADAVRILDFAHAMEYVADAGQAAHEHLPCPGVLASQEERAKLKHLRFDQWLSKQRAELKDGEASKVLDELEQLRTLMQEANADEAVDTIQKSLNYLTQRRAMLAYATFQAQGYPIGSGCVESANKLVVQSRMKGPGMHWEPSHVNPMLAMRNLACNDRWHEGWHAIRQAWLQEMHTKRRLRARPPSPKADEEHPALAAPTVQTRLSSPPKRHRTAAPTASQQPAPVPALQTGSGHPRPAATHPWRHAFLRRRPA